MYYIHNSWNPRAPFKYRRYIYIYMIIVAREDFIQAVMAIDVFPYMLINIYDFYHFLFQTYILSHLSQYTYCVCVRVYVSLCMCSYHCGLFGEEEKSCYDCRKNIIFLRNHQ